MVVFGAGVGALVLGIILMFVWGTEFFIIIKGSIPVIFILGGGLAAYLGYEEIKDKKEAGEPEDDSASLKNEVENLKEEIKELKSEK